MQQEHSESASRIYWLEPVLVSAGLVLAAGYRSFEPIWQVGEGHVALGLMAGVAYLAGFVARHRAGRGGLGHALLVTLVVTQPLLLLLWVADLSVSRIALAAELGLLFLAVLAAGARRFSPQLRVLGALAFASVAVLPTGVGLFLPQTLATAAGVSNKQYVFTSYHDLSITAHDVVPHDPQAGGSLMRLPDGRVLLVTGSGVARLLDIGNSVSASSLELGLPLDLEAHRSLGRRQPEFFRVFDVLYDQGRLFASYITWNAEQDCYALRLAEAAFDGSAAGPWKDRFESQPCVPLTHSHNTSGGRIAVLDANRLLLSVGTLGIDRVAAKDTRYEGWRAHSDYGRVLVFDTETWEYEVLSKGHRNPEGLLVAGDDVWSTEHGPHGGDELNLIKRGSDYGWPLVSYGTDYGRKTLSYGGTPGDHSGFEEPVHAWTPSVGISNLIEADARTFPMWRGDLLVGSLSGLGNGHALFRVRLLDGRAVTVEKIPVGSLVRDLLPLPDKGALLLWDGDATVRLVRTADHVFSQCTGCHNVRNEQHGIGPDLYGVVGERVARHVNYTYSPAMEALGGTWTPERLDRFLEDPQAQVPGTAMEHEGIHNPADRAEIITFLRDVSAGRPVN